jgi:hypothetical protein
VGRPRAELSLNSEKAGPTTEDLDGFSLSVTASGAAGLTGGAGAVLTGSNHVRSQGAGEILVAALWEAPYRSAVLVPYPTSLGVSYELPTPSVSAQLAQTTGGTYFVQVVVTAKTVDAVPTTQPLPTSTTMPPPTGPTTTVPTGPQAQPVIRAVHFTLSSSNGITVEVIGSGFGRLVPVPHIGDIPYFVLDDVTTQWRAGNDGTTFCSPIPCRGANGVQGDYKVWTTSTIKVVFDVEVSAGDTAYVGVANPQSKRATTWRGRFTNNVTPASALPRPVAPAARGVEPEVTPSRAILPSMDRATDWRRLGC